MSQNINKAITVTDWPSDELKHIRKRKREMESLWPTADQLKIRQIKLRVDISWELSQSVSFHYYFQEYISKFPLSSSFSVSLSQIFLPSLLFLLSLIIYLSHYYYYYYCMPNKSQYKIVTYIKCTRLLGHTVYLSFFLGTFIFPLKYEFSVTRLKVRFVINSPGFQIKYSTFRPCRRQGEPGG